MTQLLQELREERNWLQSQERDTTNVDAQITAEEFRIDMEERMERYKEYHEITDVTKAWEGLFDLYTTNRQEALIDDMQNYVDLYSERMAWITKHKGVK